MSGRDWQAFDAELRARAQEIAAELLGKPTFRAGQEWRWGRNGSLSVVIGGAKASMWFDHEAGIGGGLVDLVAREKGFSRTGALDWTADRIGMRRRHRSTLPRPVPKILSTTTPVTPQAQPGADASSRTTHDDTNPADTRADDAAARATRIWTAAGRAPADHPYLVRKQVAPLGLRCDARGHLVVPLQDADGRLHSLETIAPDGAKRFLAGGAKRGHFCVIGLDPAPMPDPSGPILICEGWATGASLHMATDHMVIAAMDAGNLLPVAEALRSRFPDADLVLFADNDAKPDRDTNPGVDAARKAAVAVNARIAVPEAIGTVGLLVIDEAFWQSGLRGIDGKATLTQDGLEPGRTSLACYGAKGKVDLAATADLVAARNRLLKALQVCDPGALRHGLLEAVGLTPEDCRHAATLKRRRMRDAGLLPGMSPVERRKRIEKVLPPPGEPWAPPGRCAALWLILA